MREIDVFGFDYDYTLAVYRWELAGLIYDRALQRLIGKFKVRGSCSGACNRVHTTSSTQYPAELRSLPHDQRFAVRGLHFDTSRSILMKLDAFCQIQPDTVYR
jgi:hypothetical protein